MKPTFSRIVHSVALTLSTLCLTVTSAFAFPLDSYGPAVDTFCQTYNGTTPFADQGCLLCHTQITGGSRNALGQLWAQTHAPSAAMCPVGNTAPVANAGPDQTVALGALVTLDGTGSSDIDGNQLTYRWSFTSRPTGSSAALNSSTTARPTFTADVAGNYVVQLIVNDTHVDSAPDQVTISTANSAPVANAGPNQTVPVGTTVTLDGSGSTDADGNQLTYQWSFTSRPTGSSATLNSSTTAHPTFTVDRSGNYTVQLIVTDNGTPRLSSAADLVSISTVNTAPVASAGPNQTVVVGTTVTLNGSGSTDVDGNPLTYEWSIVSAPTNPVPQLSDPTSATPTFVPTMSGDYVVQLIVNDGTVNSAPVNVTIMANPVGGGMNTAPVANAGPDQVVNLGATVQLDGSGSSDADGNTLHYNWALTSRPTGSNAALSNATTMTPSFVADVAGEYAVQLIVDDLLLSSQPDSVTVTTRGGGNAMPIANAGPDQKVAAGTVVTLDGSGSQDPEGAPLTYKWALIKKPKNSTAKLSDPTAARPTFKADKKGQYIAQLIVNDGLLSSAPDTVVVRTTRVPQESGVYIQRAQWDKDRAKLKVLGLAPKDAQVAIRDAASGKTLTTAGASETGRFRAYFTPPFVPCSVIADANGVYSEKTPVLGAPSKCGVKKGAPVVPKESEYEREEFEESVRR